MTDEPTRTSPRWIRIMLVASLALNLIVIGVVVGAVLRDPPPNARINGQVGEFRVLVRNLPEAQRAALRQDIRARRDEFGQQGRALAQMRRDIITLLRDTDFTEEKFAAELTRQRAFWETMGTRGQSLILTRIAAMTPQERQEFADNLEEWSKGNRRPGNRNEPQRPREP